MNTALIINVTKNFQSIKTVQTINVCKGIHYSVEFNYNGYYYLLSPFKNKFFLWFGNEQKALESKEIKPKTNIKGKTIITDINIKYRPILFNQSRKLFIVHIYYPIRAIEFYKIESENKEFNLQLIGNITLEEQENSPSSYRYNSCIVNDKYLLIGARRRSITKNNGGIYIINLDNFQYKYKLLFSYCYLINSLLCEK